MLKTSIDKAAGVKYDNDKSRMDLIPSAALQEMGRVMGFGAQKYEDHNWRKGIAWSRCVAAAMRHLAAFNGGEDLDAESGIGHLAHAAVNLSFLIEYAKTHPEFDDRYKADE